MPEACHPPFETHSPFASNYHELGVWAKMLDDAMKARIACCNRIERGGVDRLPYESQLKALETAEHSVALGMRRCYRRVVDPSIIAWQTSTPGIGEHLMARLLGCIGHPRITQRHHWEGTGHDRVLVSDGEYERRVSDLWSYCGVGDPERRRKAGMTVQEAFALGNPDAKMLVHLIAEACMKTRTSPYRAIYDDARDRYAERTHAKPCPQCGTRGKPAEIGSDWMPGHQHAAALRLVGKTVLKDLWIVSQ